MNAPAKKLGTVGMLWSLLPRKSRLAMPVLMLMVLLGTFIEALGIGLVIPVMTTISKGGTGSSSSFLQPIFDALGIRSVSTMVGASVLLLGAAFLVKNIYMLALQWRQARFSNAVSQYLASTLFKSFLRRPYTFHLQRNSSELLTVVQTEVNMTVNLIKSLMLLMTEFLVGVSVAGLMFFTESVAAAATLVVLVGGAVSYSRFSRFQMNKFGRLRQHGEPLRTKSLIQGFASVKDLKISGRYDNFACQFDEQNLALNEIGIRAGIMKSVVPMWTEMLAIFGLTVVIWSMIWQGRTPERIIPLLGLFVVATWRFVPSINKTLNLINDFRFSRSAVESLYNEFKYIKTQSEIVKAQAVFNDKIEMRNLTFSYANTPAPSLRDVNIVVRKGETVGFIGPSGAGKSTLVDVILGLLPPSSGELLVDGVNMHEHNIEWQSTIGYVAQAIYLTDDSIRRNVAFGIAEKEIDDAALERALKSAQLWDFVQSLPEKDKTIVGERGIRVSGGQRQRIGIARALYHEPQVLVLDEATSSLDIETETEVMSAIRALQGFKTILIVAHRLSTVQHCDRVYKIEDATIVGEGTLEELTKSAS
jgi:ABC-type multidrug transport system fused ATPase/permease subunit